MAARVIFNFRDPDAIRGWYSIDDVVMGGCSRSQVTSDPAEGMIFAGTPKLTVAGQHFLKNWRLESTEVAPILLPE